MNRITMETNRVILRPWRESDAETLYKWASDPDVGPRAGWPPHQNVEESLEIIRTVFNDVLHTWAIVLKETDWSTRRQMPFSRRPSITVSASSDFVPATSPTTTA